MPSTIAKGGLIGAVLGLVATIALAVASRTVHTGVDVGESAEWFQTYVYLLGFPLSPLFEAVRFGQGGPFSSILGLVLPLITVPINWSIFGGILGAFVGQLVKRN